jgi:hypothetical protein
MTTIQKIDKSVWLNQAAEMKQRGLVRCEWLTATHNGGDSFEISLMLSNEDLTKSLILSTDIEISIESLIDVYPSADFHEREVSQMFGVEFIGNNGQAQLIRMKMQSDARHCHQVCYRSGHHESFNDRASSCIMHFLHALCSGVSGLVHYRPSAFRT